MKKLTTTKKLKLDTTKVRALTHAELENAAGGWPVPTRNCWAPPTCALCLE